MKSATNLQNGKNYTDVPTSYKIMATLTYSIEWVIRCCVVLVAMLQCLLVFKHPVDKCLTSETYLAPEGRWMMGLAFSQMLLVACFTFWRLTLNPFELRSEEHSRLSTSIPARQRLSAGAKDPKFAIKPMPTALRGSGPKKADKVWTPYGTIKGSQKRGAPSEGGNTVKVRRPGKGDHFFMKSGKQLSVGDRLTEQRLQHVTSDDESNDSAAEETSSLMEEDSPMVKQRKLPPLNKNSTVRTKKE